MMMTEKEKKIFQVCSGFMVKEEKEMMTEEKIESIASIDLEEYYITIDEDYRKKYFGVQEDK